MKTLLVGKSKLEGEVTLQGAKNAALKFLAASLLTSGDVLVERCPVGMSDVQVHLDMLNCLGKVCKYQDNNSVLISEGGAVTQELMWDGRSIRNTLLVLGALFARHGYGKVPLPGGCRLGERKYDLHVDILEAFGGSVRDDHDYLVVERDVAKPLKGATVHLPLRSTGATENFLLIASLSAGKSVLYNPHVRPEVINLIELLRLMGADVRGFGQERIEVVGRPEGLSGARIRTIPDNMEALTWMIGSAMTSGHVLIKDFPFDHLEVPLIFLRESGVKIFREGYDALVYGGACYPVEIATGPYPGINSDMQPLIAAFATQSQGTSKIVDLRFPGRYQYMEEMQKMGVKAKIDGDILIIRGGDSLQGSTVRATDLRAGVALCMLGMVSEGETRINDAWQIERGYADFSKKARSLGANVDEI